MKTKLTSNLECNLAAPESILKSETYTTSPSPSLVHSLGVLPLSHNSMSPVMLPHPHAGVSYTIYLHPSQAQTATTYSPSFVLQSVPCTNVTGVKTALEVNSKVPFSKMTTEEGDGNVVKDDTNFLNAKEKKVTKIESTPRSLLKRSQALQENSLIKKCKHGQKSLGVPMVSNIRNV